MFSYRATPLETFMFPNPSGRTSRDRTTPHRAAIWIHAGFELVAYTLYIAGFGMGIWMITKIKSVGFDMLSNSVTDYHPIIGIVILVLVFFQQILGVLHHLALKRYNRRQFWSYGHIWLGRIIITLGNINGGLGLKLSDNTTAGEIAYGVVPGIIWLVWVAAAIYGDMKRTGAQRQLREGMPYKGERQYHSEHGVASIDAAAVHAPAHAPPANAPPKYEAPRYQ